MSFKEVVSYDDRVKEAKKIRENYEDRIPVIIEKSKKAKCATLDKYKFLVPEEMRVQELLYVIRKRLRLQSDIALYLYVGNQLPKLSELIFTLYQQHKDIDGFLYVQYDTESTFG